jgi:mono/diheme cytochrome c family protein
VFAKVVNVIEALVLAMAAVFVVLLFAYRPALVHPSPTTASRAAPAGDAIFAANCSTCHGDHGEGAIGPKLAGGAVVTNFPKKSDEIRVVTNGLGGMPAWKDRLTPAEIDAVVNYTRSGL